MSDETNVVSPMVMKAARKANEIASRECNTCPEDGWKLYGSEYIRDAQEMLTECGALECLEAANGLHRKLYELAERYNDRSCDYDVCPEVRTYDSAIAKVRGTSTDKARDVSSDGVVYGSTP